MRFVLGVPSTKALRWILGVDEAGRGPLAGPVAVGIVAVPENFNVAREFPGIADSKQLSEAAREKLYAQLRERREAGDLDFCVRFASADVIDGRGLTKAVAGAVARGVRFLAPKPRDARIYLDGLLHAPPEYAQQTIIGGDELLPVIALASIAAKVTRDRRMRAFARLFPNYGFEEHKGYGTKSHYAALKRHGPCEIHRRSFLEN